ncbi:MAG: serine/threonine protein kinase [Betaproteobacteria bacterium]|nr:serine/threonine protein kinase [Betaproteobacteria bacterium]
MRSGLTQAGGADAGHPPGIEAGQLKPVRAGTRIAPSLGQWTLIVLTGCLALAWLGRWTYVSINDSVREIRQTGLATLLNTQATALSVWIEDRKRNAERWTADPDLVADARRLTQIGARLPASREMLCAPLTQSLAGLRRQPLALTEERVMFNLLDGEGRILASSHFEQCGRSVNEPSFLAALAKAWAGESRFVPPLLERMRIDIAAPPASAPGPVAPTTPLLWMLAPVRDTDGQVIAVLAFGKLSSAQFSTILRVSRPGDTGESYAFDTAARMLSDSRHGSASDSGKSYGFGHRIAPPTDPEFAPPAESEPTRLVQDALASRLVSDRARQSGILLEPYDSYRGVSVIGAWQWMPDYEMGLALEVEAREAYEPLSYLTSAFLLLFFTILVMAALALAASWWLVVLRLREARRVGRYELIRQIGEGGISKVYLARHENMRRPTAVKVLKAYQASDEMLARFEREVQLCSQLSHPNTIEIYDYGRTRSGLIYYAMEFVNGITLAELVQRHGAQPASRVIHILLQVCGALKEAHDHGLVHRDIKPQNIMLSMRGGAFDVVKVLDFGLVKEIDRETTRDLTQYSKVLGTPLYMAPERLRNPSDADARADIYALAATAFHVLSARNIFDASTDHELTYQVLNVAPPRASALVPGVPVELDDLLFRCLAKERDERPASIDIVQEALELLARNERWTPRQSRLWWQAHLGNLVAGMHTREVEPDMVPGSHGPVPREP